MYRWNTLVGVPTSEVLGQVLSLLLECFHRSSYDSRVLRGLEGKTIGSIRRNRSRLDSIFELNSSIYYFESHSKKQYSLYRFLKCYRQELPATFLFFYFGKNPAYGRFCPVYFPGYLRLLGNTREILQIRCRKRMLSNFKSCQAHSFSSTLIPACFSNSLILLAHFWKFTRL
ncbi:hypothetical protein CLV95_11030 [Leptospira borgpetersenii serovar Javanica]|nr:Uncharacterized protein LB4E_3132 [Leptospira borgpetersenii str. 4E]PTM46497.1 hypothetical protein CLV95_11030 [Leptospira borgpetersenii serovar Javanica]